MILDCATAVRSVARQRHIVDVVDLVKRIAKGFGALVLSLVRLALFGVGLGCSLGKRSGLSLPRLLRSFERSKQLSVFNLALPLQFRLQPTGSVECVHGARNNYNVIGW